MWKLHLKRHMFIWVLKHNDNGNYAAHGGAPQIYGYSKKKLVDIIKKMCYYSIVFCIIRDHDKS
jgi:hypothetical protein